MLGRCYRAQNSMAMLGSDLSPQRSRHLIFNPDFGLVEIAKGMWRGPLRSIALLHNGSVGSFVLRAALAVDHTPRGWRNQLICLDLIGADVSPFCTHRTPHFLARRRDLPMVECPQPACHRHGVSIECGIGWGHFASRPHPFYL